MAWRFANDGAYMITRGRNAEGKPNGVICPDCSLPIEKSAGCAHMLVRETSRPPFAVRDRDACVSCRVDDAVPALHRARVLRVWRCLRAVWAVGEHRGVSRGTSGTFRQTWRAVRVHAQRCGVGNGRCVRFCFPSRSVEVLRVVEHFVVSAYHKTSEQYVTIANNTNTGFVQRNRRWHSIKSNRTQAYLIVRPVTTQAVCNPQAHVTAQQQP